MSSSLSCFQFSMSNIPLNTLCTPHHHIQKSVGYPDISGISTYQWDIYISLPYPHILLPIPSPSFFSFSCLPAAELRSSAVCALHPRAHEKFPHSCPLYQTLVSFAFSRPLCRRRLLGWRWFHYYACAPLNRHDLRLHDDNIRGHFHSCLQYRRRSP